jgi:hypothetical protein
MNTKTIKTVLGVAAVLVIGVGAIMFSTREPKVQDSMPTPTPTPTVTDTTTKTPAPVANTYSLSDVAAHTTESSCWTTISGDVYDLTQWIAKHPGGDRAILSICGADGTRAFEGQHGGNNKPNTILASFKIGSLSK